MSVCVCGPLDLDVTPDLPVRDLRDQPPSLASALAAARFGAEARIAGFARLAVETALDRDTRVVLAQGQDACADDDAAILACFANPALGGKRRILAAGPDMDARLFGCADMLIFDPDSFASLFRLDRAPETVEDLCVAQGRLVLPNQAIVVPLGAAGTVALWADRAMVSVVLGAVAPRGVGASAVVCGVIAACVDLGIGPAEALRYASAAATLMARTPGALSEIPVRAALDRFLEQAA